MNTPIFSKEGSNYLNVPENNFNEYLNSYNGESQVSARVTQYRMWRCKSKTFAVTPYESCRNELFRTSYLPDGES